MNNKKGDTNWVLIMLILGVIVLVILAAGFMIGWNRLLPWLSTNNVDTTVTQCQIACTTNSKYAWCTQPRNVSTDEVENLYKDVTCEQLVKENIGISACSQITCTA